MKKYPIEFTNDYIEFEEFANSENEYVRTYWSEHISEHQKELEFCKKWRGKEVTLLEAEELISEFEAFIFNGKTINIINGLIDY